MLILTIIMFMEMFPASVILVYMGQLQVLQQLKLQKQYQQAVEHALLNGTVVIGVNV